MKPEDIAERRERITVAMERIKDVRARTAKNSQFYRSQVFRDALVGNTDWLLPARDDTEYLTRLKHYLPHTEEAIASLVAESASLPTIAEQRWDTAFPFRIGIIADTFLLKSFDGTATWVPITPRNFHEEVPSLDLLLVTSTWRGIAHEWWGLSLPLDPKRQLVNKEIVPLAHKHNIPVAFYSKEDPPNFATFLSLAQHADVVFTTASEVVPKYEENCTPGTPIHVLPFGVSYKHHNPIGSHRHTALETMFAGSWHRHKYPERRRAGEAILNGAVEAHFPLYIADRNLELDHERYRFPEQFLPFLHGPLAHDTLLLLQRLLPVGINLNSVTASQTMFANRVLELQAMGTLVVSNYNAGVNSQFPHVYMPDSKIDAQCLFSSLTLPQVRQVQREGIRHAFTANTAFDRVRALLIATGLIDEVEKSSDNAVAIAGLSGTQFKAFAAMQQTKLSLVPATSKAAGTCKVTIDVQERDAHDPHLVQDAINAFKYSNVDSVVLSSHDSVNELHHELEPAHGEHEGATVARLTSIAPGTHSGLQLQLPLEPREPAVIHVSENATRELSVIVPVYNNGSHLEHKCFASLKRSTIFDRMQIILVDDGSTDAITPHIVDHLVAAHDNVQSFAFEPGGSGSASRPRNKGLELARAPYTTYLDPDNEAINDGYAKLLTMVKDDNLDFAIGNMVKYRNRREIIYNASLLSKNLVNEVEVPDDFIEAIKFQPMSIQALVANTQWLKGLGITQPEGAVGQDSYFFQQMSYYAKRIGTTKTPIHTYYAAVASSTVNSLGPRFYQKYIPLEQHRAGWLQDEGLLESYNALRLEAFVKGWYLNKLSLVPEDERTECLALIRELVAYYGPHDWEDPEIAEALGL
ncbi:glycosyltransferase [Brevibacterium paucivorans]|uniref:Glycosyltransferase 2-like domain-containing protein n=1 Tax=Brevibacterium paucivorans TaxID=170994 RepID=A0A2N6VRA1_9MICO|nr:glycosyltransferase [Brevibacterium paucivorans]PMD06626.1 hypothetical protein CJ199_04550 [Brevibacterium paucivorans]